MESFTLNKRLMHASRLLPQGFLMTGRSLRLLGWWRPRNVKSSPSYSVNHESFDERSRLPVPSVGQNRPTHHAVTVWFTVHHITRIIIAVCIPIYNITVWSFLSSHEHAAFPYNRDLFIGHARDFRFVIAHRSARLQSLFCRQLAVHPQTWIGRTSQQHHHECNDPYSQRRFCTATCSCSRQTYRRLAVSSL